MDCCSVTKDQANSFELDWECPSCKRGKARLNKIADRNSKCRFKKSNKQTSVLQVLADRTEIIELSYPWDLDMEAFHVCLKPGQEDEYTTADEVVETMRCLAEELPELQVPAEAAAQARQELDFKALLEASKHFNASVLRLGLFNQTADDDKKRNKLAVSKRAPTRMVAHIMSQVYASQ